MCLVLYLGSDSRLPTTEPWDATRPFSVSDVTADCPSAVRNFVEQPFIYLLHSIDGCGCGFYVEAAVDREATYDGMPPDVAELCRKTDRQHRLSVEGLHNYLRQVSADAHSPLRLLVSWDGKEDTAPKRRLSATPSFFRPSDNEFHLEEFTLFEIMAEKP